MAGRGAGSRGRTASHTRALGANSRPMASESVAALIAGSVSHASNRSMARLARDISARRLLRQTPPGGAGPPMGGAPSDPVVAAADFLRAHLGDPADYSKDPLRTGRDMEAMLRKIARRHPGLAAEANRHADMVRDARVASEAELRGLVGRGMEVLRRSGGGGGGTLTPRRVEDQLRRVARGGGADAAEAGTLADEVRQVRGRLNEIASGVPTNYTPPASSGGGSAMLKSGGAGRGSTTVKSGGAGTGSATVKSAGAGGSGSPSVKSGGGTTTEGPTVTGPAAETGPGKVGPTATGELPPTGELPVVRPRFTIGSVVGLAGNVLVSLALWWLSSKLAEWQERFIASQFAVKVDPHVREAMVKLAPTAEKLTAEDPSQPVYTIITVKFKYGGWRGSVGGSEAIYDVDFVGPVDVSRTKVSKEHTVWETSDCTKGGGFGCAYSGLRQVTYSVEVKFDETEDQHFWRMMAAQAAKDVKAGRSVRVQAELGDLEDLPQPGKKRDDRWVNQGVREHERKQKLAYKIRWTKLYMQSAAKRLEYAELYGDARRYLDELEGRAAPAPPGLGPTGLGPRSPTERKQLDEWLKVK
jgi:hypothetical protein